MVTLLPLFNQRRRISRKDNPLLTAIGFSNLFVGCIVSALIITGLSLVIGLSLVGKYEDGWDVSVEVLAIPFLCILLPCSFACLCWFGYCFFECFLYCRYQTVLCPRALRSLKLCHSVLALQVPTALCPWRPLRSLY